MSRFKSFIDLGAIITRPKEDVFPAVRAASRKEKGGAPEDARRGNDMLYVDKRPAASKPLLDTPLFSEANVAETRRAMAWLQNRVERAAHEGSFTETINLTPVIAELLLERNESNRNVRHRAVDTYATDIEAGNWCFNGEAIKVSVEGLLNDGQHRCHAVIKAARSIRTNITFGLERDSRMTVDQGAVRTAGNYLSMAGHESGNQLAAVASLMWQYENLGAIDNKRPPTKTQINQTVEDHPGFADSIKAIPSGARVGRSRSVLAFCHYIIARRSKLHADSFFLRLVLGDGLSRRDPIYHCRERLLAPSKMRAEEKVEIILRTWNAHRRGQVQTKCSPVLGELPKIER